MNLLGKLSSLMACPFANGAIASASDTQICRRNICRSLRSALSCHAQGLSSLSAVQTGDDPGATVMLGSRVVSYDLSVPSISLADGTVLQGYLVVGADGKPPFPVQSL